LNLKEGRSKDFTPPHLDTVTSLAIMGDTLVSGSKDKNLRFWDMNTSLCKTTTYNAHKDFITCMAQDKKYIYSGCKDGTIKAWEAPN
jgi:WD40 repeat protein